MPLVSVPKGVRSVVTRCHCGCRKMSEASRLMSFKNAGKNVDVSELVNPHRCMTGDAA